MINDHFPLVNFFLIITIVMFLIIDKIALKFRKDMEYREMLEIKLRYEALKDSTAELKVKQTKDN